jgi:hypothetical protein
LFVAGPVVTFCASVLVGTATDLLPVSPDQFFGELFVQPGMLLFRVLTGSFGGGPGQLLGNVVFVFLVPIYAVLVPRIGVGLAWEALEDERPSPEERFNRHRDPPQNPAWYREICAALLLAIVAGVIIFG